MMNEANANILELPASTTHVDTERGSIFFIGTATVLLQYAGFTHGMRNEMYMSSEVALGRCSWHS